MKYLFTLTCVLFTVLFSNGQTKYVTQAGAGAKDGTNWANAWDAAAFANNINTVPPGTSVWMAKGIYKPTKDNLGNVVDEMFPFGHSDCTFMIPSGVKLYGGFAGTETSISQRVQNLIYGTNKTSLDGANTISPFPDMSNSYHLITLTNSSVSTIVDGFYFYNFSRQAMLINSTAAAASSPTVINCNFGTAYFASQGAIGINATGSMLSKPVISGCFFNYSASNYAYFIPITAEGNCRPEISNCLFSKTEHSQGCLVFIQIKGASITNCTFYNASSTFSSPPVCGIYNLADSLYFNNCIFRNDTDPGNGYIYNFNIGGSNLVSLRNCATQPQDHYDADEPAQQSGNIFVNPAFTDSLDLDGIDDIFGTADDGLKLKPDSELKDYGVNDYLPAIAVNDILGNNRVSGCKVDLGAYEYQIPNSNIIVLPQSNVQSCTQYPIPDSVTTFIDPTTCLVAATVNPIGVNPVSGITQVCVVRSTTVPVVNGIPYVQRHYDIEPLINAATSTARITVYYTQQEFNNYNAVATTFPQLPTFPSDAAGKANIRIEQDHGISLTGVPGTYSGTTVYINPDDNDIIWNSTSNIWEVSFNVTGFSGFFLTTFVTVPVTLVSFSGQANGEFVKLKWKTTAEYSFRSFDVEKSNDGTNFRSLQNVNASGDVNGHDYSIDDLNPNNGNNFYRLKMIDIDGTFKYSSVILIKYQSAGTQSFSISPNPADKSTTISITGNLSGDVSILIFDARGNKVSDLSLGNLNTQSFSTDIDLKRFKPGVYIVSVVSAGLKMSKKLIVQ